MNHPARNLIPVAAPRYSGAMVISPGQAMTKPRRRSPRGSLGSEALALLLMMVLIGQTLPLLFTIALVRNVAAAPAPSLATGESGGLPTQAPLDKVPVQTPGDPTMPVAQDPLFPAGGDLAGALAQAAREGRTGVAVLFEMTDCGECARLRAGPLSDPGVRDAYRQPFVTLGLHADTPQPLRAFDGTATTSAAFALGQRVVALPTVVLYDLNGLPVARQSGGGTDAGTLIRLARYAAAKGYETAPFDAWHPEP
ncbi:thioredoxin family protein [Thiobaca trueperi]|uniref:Thioredoxin-like protein n=1 Tax=Thiobaca trueperi TaxID=127458 RepID=A0A4R3MVN4_9GAMM|nr:thioredoxin fold domain-containing protein [Thiobaca trueperi]TCT19461.1 thioredoxin-like protein [Thiobaca trueperi]